MRTLFVVSGLFVVGCGASGGDSQASQVFDPCGAIDVAAPGATTDQRASIADAFALWRARGVAPFTLVDGASAAITVEFRDAATSIYGFYDDATAIVYVNLRLDDPVERAITIAHELGHSIGLDHIALDSRRSVMNPGNLVVAPTASDAATVSDLWGGCAQPPNN